MSLSEYNLDQTTDYSNKVLHRLFNDLDLPAFVKDAAVNDVFDTDKLAESGFADIYHRAFPIKTPAQVYVSNAFFQDKVAALRKQWGRNYVHTVQDNLNKAAEFHKIAADVKAYNDHVELQKKADYKQNFIFEVDIDGTPFQFFGIKTASDFKTAADKFASHISNYPFQWRKKISEGFVQKAASFEVDELPDVICKYAGMWYPDVTDIKNHIWHRSTKIADEQVKKAYQEEFSKMAEASSTKDEVFDLAEAMYETETTLGMTRNPKVASVLGDTVDHFFTIPIEKVAGIIDVVKMAKWQYPVSELQKVPANVYKEAFGADIDPANAEQLREVLPTMPLSDIEFFVERSGVNPI